MGLTEGHWLEDEEPELTEKQLEDILWKYNKIFERGYQKGFSDGKSAVLSEQEPIKPNFHINEKFSCGQCGRRVYLEDNYCSCCGRRIKWNA